MLVRGSFVAIHGQAVVYQGSLQVLGLHAGRKCPKTVPLNIHIVGAESYILPSIAVRVSPIHR